MPPAATATVSASVATKSAASSTYPTMNAPRFRSITA